MVRHLQAWVLPLGVAGSHGTDMVPRLQVSDANIRSALVVDSVSATAGDLGTKGLRRLLAAHMTTNTTLDLKTIAARSCRSLGPSCSYSLSWPSLAPSCSGCGWYVLSSLDMPYGPALGPCVECLHPPLVITLQSPDPYTLLIQVSPTVTVKPPLLPKVGVACRSSLL